MIDDSEECASEDCASEAHSNRSNVQPAALHLCERTAGIFRAMGDVNRLRLLSVLNGHEMCVTELTETLKDNLPAISQRLKLLRSERLVRTRRQGKHVYYRLADEHIAQLISNGLAHGSEPAHD